MKTLRMLALFSLIAGLLVFGLSLLEYLALSDIHNDYVSRSVLERFSISAASLPDWSTAAGEWQVVVVTRFASLGFLALNTLVLGLCWRTLRHSAQPAN